MRFGFGLVWEERESVCFVCLGKPTPFCGPSLVRLLGGKRLHFLSFAVYNSNNTTILSRFEFYYFIPKDLASLHSTVSFPSTALSLVPVPCGGYLECDITGHCVLCALRRVMVRAEPTGNSQNDHNLLEIRDLRVLDRLIAWPRRRLSNGSRCCESFFNTDFVDLGAVGYLRLIL